MADDFAQLEAALSRFPKKVAIKVETTDAPVAVLAGVFSFSRFDGGGSDILAIEMVPEWTVHLRVARITSWREDQRPRALEIQYAGLEIRMTPSPEASRPSWDQTLERFTDA